MTAREIRVELPAEPPMRAVVLVDTKDLTMGGLGDSHYAFQRLQDSGPSAWHMVGREHRPMSWPELIGVANGRPILVLWEPS